MRRFSSHALVGAVLLSLFTTVGGIYSFYGREIGTFGGKEEAFIWLVFCTILTPIFYVVLVKVFSRTYLRDEFSPAKGVYSYFLNHTFVCSYIVLFLVFLPYIIIHYPGSINTDAYYQLNMFLGIKPYTNKHPLLSTLIYGFIFSLGLPISSNFGLFCCVFLQTILHVYSFSVCVSKIRKLNIGKYTPLLALCFFAIVPTWGFYAQTVLKDSLYFPVFLLYTIYYFELFDYQVGSADTQPPSSWTWVRLVVCGIIISLLRHGIIAVIIATLMLLLLVSVRSRTKLLASLACLLVVYAALFVIMSRATNATGYPTRAFFSIPFQQTARCLREAPDEISDEDYEAINAVLKAEVIGDVFNPLLSDPVKDTYRRDSTPEDLARYFATWFRMFFKFPRIYIDTFLQYTYGYFDPFHNYTGADHVKAYIAVNPKTFESLGIEYHFSPETRALIDGYGKRWVQVLLLSELMAPGTYAWVAIVCFLLLSSKGRRRQLAGFVVPFAQILVCVLSPVSGYVRYSLPLMAITPLIIAWTLKEVQEGDAPRDVTKPARRVGRHYA